MFGIGKHEEGKGNSQGGFIPVRSASILVELKKRDWTRNAEKGVNLLKEVCFFFSQFWTGIREITDKQDWICFSPS